MGINESSVAKDEDSSNASAVARVEQFLTAIEKRKDVNAFITVDSNGARAQAEKIDASTADLPLRGAVIAVKDNIHVAGLPNTAGTAALKTFIPQTSSSIVESLANAGAVIIGKTGLHELAYGATSNNFTFGPVRNPADLSKTPGGSSGGSAAAVAAGLADVAIGTDTGCSVRLPAALTGTVGFRPTVNRYPNDNIVLISPTRDTAGFIGNSVADIELFDRVITKRPDTIASAKLDGLRLGVPRKHFFENLDPDVAEATETFLKELKNNGVELINADLDSVPELNEKVSFTIVLYETSVVLPRYLEEYDTSLSVRNILDNVTSPDVKPILEAAFSGDITEDIYKTALEVDRPKLQAAYRDYFEKHNVDAVIFPASPITARDIDGILDGVTVNGETQDTFATYIQNADPASNAGIPGISLPIAVSSSGLPIGIELDAPAGADDRLLAIAYALESVSKA